MEASTSGLADLDKLVCVLFTLCVDWLNLLFTKKKKDYGKKSAALAALTEHVESKPPKEFEWTNCMCHLRFTMRGVNETGKKNTSTYMENTVFNKRINMLELNGLLLSGWLLQKTVPNYILLNDNNKILWLWLRLSGPVFWVMNLSKPCQQTRLRASRRAAELHMRHVLDEGPRLSSARHAPRAKSSAFLLTSSRGHKLCRRLQTVAQKQCVKTFLGARETTN